MLINLLNNAQKYNKASEPKITISVKNNSDQVIILVEDNGDPIPKGMEAVIFEKFSRIDDQSKAGGAGLGLAICREIMTNLDGRIEYFAGNEGPCFQITFPRSPSIS